MKSALAHPREFTGRHMLVLMLAFFGVVIGVNIALAVLANTSWTGLIVSNGYDASQNFGKEQDRIRAQVLLGWRAEVSHSNGVLGVAFATKEARPLAGLKVTGTLRRAVTDRQDMALAFTETGIGIYTAPAKIASGLWDLEIDASDPQGHSFRQIDRFVARGD